MCDSDWWIKRMCVVRTVLPPELPELPDPDPFEPDPVSDPESDPEPDPDPPPPPPITTESSLFQVSFILLSMKILVSKSYKNVWLKIVCIQNWPKSTEMVLIGWINLEMSMLSGHFWMRTTLSSFSVKMETNSQREQSKHPPRRGIVGRRQIKILF